MGYVSTAFTERAAAAVSTAWHIPVDLAGAERLHGGQESAAYRIGNHVVRVGAPWRTAADLRWCGLVAAAAARRVPEAVAPVPTTRGRTLIRVDGRPVTLWPFVHGRRGDDRDEGQREQAARLLARVHRALADADLGPPPARTVPAGAIPEFTDNQLDAWLARFWRGRRRQPVHGDFYAGNVLVDDGRIVALVDWDEAWIDVAEWDLAGAAWEWGDGLGTLALDAAGRFVEQYSAEGGTVVDLDEVALRQLIRERIRREVAYDRAARPVSSEAHQDDIAYQRRQLAAFHALRPG